MPHRDQHGERRPCPGQRHGILTFKCDDEACEDCCPPDDNEEDEDDPVGQDLQ